MSAARPQCHASGLSGHRRIAECRAAVPLWRPGTDDRQAPVSPPSISRPRAGGPRRGVWRCLFRACAVAVPSVRPVPTLQPATDCVQYRRARCARCRCASIRNCRPGCRHRGRRTIRHRRSDCRCWRSGAARRQTATTSGGVKPAALIASRNCIAAFMSCSHARCNRAATPTSLGLCVGGQWSLGG